MDGSVSGEFRIHCDGRLVRLVDDDAGALDEALAALAELSGEHLALLEESG